MSEKVKGKRAWELGIQTRYLVLARLSLHRTGGVAKHQGFGASIRAPVLHHYCKYNAAGPGDFILKYLGIFCVSAHP